jgi:signal transduction histidine kinase
MRLAPHSLRDRARWLIAMRWLACLGALPLIWAASAPLHLVHDPLPLYGIALGMALYNLAFMLAYRRPAWRGDDHALILAQVILDLVALTLLLYFADIAYNPFLFYFVFHVVIASILVPGRTPYVVALLASALVGSVMLLQHLGWIPVHPLAFPWRVAVLRGGPSEVIYLLGIFAAFVSTLGITVFFTTSVSAHVEKAHAQIRQHQKMIGIGQLVAGVAHQIANPLDGLQNGLRQIGQWAEGDPRVAETVPRLLGALDRVEKVARRLQEFARPQGLDLQACDVNREVESALLLFEKSLAAKDVTLDKGLAPLPPAWGDPYGIQEVVFNLCANSIDAMPRGGRLVVRSYQRAEGGRNGDQSVVIEVGDTGVGIPEDQIEKIFEPFFTTKAAKGGTGLGLGLCRMLVSEMGGRIEVNSAPNRGSTFWVLLPAAVAGEGPAP